MEATAGNRTAREGTTLPEEKNTRNVRDLLRVGRAMKLVWSASPGWTVAAVGLTFLQGLLPLATVWLIKLIVDGVTKGVAGPDRGAAFREVVILIVVAGAVGLAGVILRSLATVVDQALSQTVTDHVTDVIHSQSVAVDLEYYENPRYHDALYRAQQEAPYRPTSIVNNLTSTGQALVSLIAMAGLLLTLHWAVGLIVLGAAVPGALVRFRYAGRLFSWQRRRTNVERESAYGHWLLTNSTYAKELRFFGLGEHFRAWYRELRRTLRRELIGLARSRSMAEFLAGFGAVAAIFGTFAYIAWRAIQGTITVGMMVAYYQAFQTSLTSLQSVLGGLVRLYEDSLFLSYYEEFMALEPHISSPTRPEPVPRPLVEGIRFDNVRFRYPGTERTALENISLTLRKGEVTALVGPNGSGKTTLVKLLCRLYDPTAGAITLDGVDLRELDLLDLRRELSLVFQDFAQYQLTASENIRLGDISVEPGDPLIETAARDAGAHAVLANLRLGYDTMLGRWFEGGEELSVGEWQKVALARAFLRNAQVFVLDEPASALDPHAEWDVFRKIKELASNRVVVVISHRLSVVRLADRIHLLDGGRIVESGDHNGLMALDGHYAEMYRLQGGMQPGSTTEPCPTSP